MTCSVVGCEAKATRRGWCQNHYNRWRRNGDPEAGRRNTRGMGEVDRLEHYVERVPFSPCWYWTGALTSAGYGTTHIRGETMRAHRAAFLVHKGDIPEGMLVRHTCDERSCVNPDHLLLGTPQDNMNDKVERGRCPAGVVHPNAKLRLQDLRLIRSTKIPITALADHLGVSKATIDRARRGETYAAEAAGG